MLAALLAALTLLPWKGVDLPTATQAQAKYRLTVSGAPGATVTVTTSGLAKGWIAAFCDMRVCSPNRTVEMIPSSGHVDVQLELIREDNGAPAHTKLVLRGSDGSTVSLSI